MNMKVTINHEALREARPEALARELAKDHGIMLGADFKGFLLNEEVKYDFGLAADAQPTLVSQSNAGIPAYLVNYLDPEFVRVLLTPMKAAEILSEVKKGDWTTKTSQFPTVESTGETTAYGDYSESGSTGANYNWIPRQSYLFQTMTQWGELELATAGEARINHAANLNIASALVLAKFHNKSYFYGISGLQNYGLLNDPSLPTPISPSAGPWASQPADVIFADIDALYAQLVLQTEGIVERDTPMTLALSPVSEALLTKTNQYNVNVYDQIKKNFPNIRVISAVEYATVSGNLVQLIADKLENIETAYCAFNEKMRAHPVIVQTSSWKQKKTGGTWGTIIRRPFAIAQLLGV